MSPQNDDLYKPLSDQFILPTNRSIEATRLPADVADQPCTYLCGNSLGPISTRSETLIKQQLDVWRNKAVEGHFTSEKGPEWVKITDKVTPHFAEIVGADEKEVAVMGTLTANLHLMMSTFYKPTAQRFKILCEAKAFPSDQYAFASQAAYHGFDPSSAVLEVWPREGEHTLREEDILDVIQREGASIALVLFSGVQYYTGQWFPMQNITKKAKEQGCIVGWDLAHAVGNIPMSLHDWDVDFAVWCTYKYLNSGPGGIAGLFVHNKWDDTVDPKLTGWWGNDLSSRFKMLPHFQRIRGAQGFQQSNPSILDVVSLLGPLELLKEAGGIHASRVRSLKLTSALESKLKQSQFFIPLSESTKTTKRGFTIITPEDPESRGAQLSLLVLPAESGAMKAIFGYLGSCGVIGDKREPDVIRLAPAPMYNTMKDVESAVKHLEDAFLSLQTS
jgi:kynureninase